MRTKILAVLAEASEPLDIQAIAEGAGAQVKSVSEALSRLNKDEFVDNPEKGFWQIKDEGRQELNRIREQEAKSKEIEQEPTEPHGEMETVPLTIRPFQIHWGEVSRGTPGAILPTTATFCFNLGEQYLKQYMLKKRGYK